MTETKKKSNAGKKSKYPTHVEPYLDRISQWAMNGADDKGIAGALGVAYSTFNDYKTKYPELSEALKVSKEVADDNVVSELYKSAIGRDVEEITQEPDGQGGFITTKKVKKHIPGNVSAQIFWLKNRRTEWRDQHNIDHGGEVSHAHSVAENLSTEDLLKIAKAEAEKPEE